MFDRHHRSWGKTSMVNNNHTPSFGRNERKTYRFKAKVKLDEDLHLREFNETFESVISDKFSVNYDMINLIKLEWNVDSRNSYIEFYIGPFSYSKNISDLEKGIHTAIEDELYDCIPLNVDCIEEIP